MGNAVAKVFVFLLVVLGVFLWIGMAITDMTGGEKKAAVAVEITPEGGEAIFWGKGRCYTCHSLGDRGSAVRCPNLGQFGDKFPLFIGERAAERAKVRSEKTGTHYTATDYLVESMADPGAYVVDGYKNEMAIVYAPPISLSLTEIQAIVAYLQSQGGELDLEAIESKPSEVTQKFYNRIKAASAAGGGDPGNGAEVFADNCVDCHRIKDEGGQVGPDLSSIGKKGIKFISDSILKPAQEIYKGFETFEVILQSGRKLVGVKSRDEADGIDITDKMGEVKTISRADIKEIKQDDTSSVMPNDLNEAMTVKDFMDLQSFLIMQKGQ